MTDSIRTAAPTTLDLWHGAIVDAVCATDAQRVLAGERRFIRLAVAHEFCLSGGCVDWPTVVAVYAVVPGVRIRQPMLAEGATA